MADQLTTVEVINKANQEEKHKEEEAKVQIEKKNKEEEDLKKQEKANLLKEFKEHVFENPVVYLKEKIQTEIIGDFDRYTFCFGNNHGKEIIGSNLLDIALKVLEELNLNLTNAIIYPELLGADKAKEFIIMYKNNPGISCTKLGYTGNKTIRNLSDELQNKHYKDEIYNLDLYKWDNLKASMDDYIGINMNILNVIISIFYKYIKESFDEVKGNILIQEILSSKLSNFKYHQKVLDNYRINNLNDSTFNLYSKGRKSLNTGAPKIPKVKKTKTAGNIEDEKNKYNNVSTVELKNHMDNHKLTLRSSALSTEVTKGIPKIDIDKMDNVEVNN